MLFVNVVKPGQCVAMLCVSGGDFKHSSAGRAGRGADSSPAAWAGDVASLHGAGSDMPRGGPRTAASTSIPQDRSSLWAWPLGPPVTVWVVEDESFHGNGHPAPHPFPQQPEARRRRPKTRPHRPPASRPGQVTSPSRAPVSSREGGSPSRAHCGNELRDPAGPRHRARHAAGSAGDPAPETGPLPACGGSEDRRRRSGSWSSG